VQRHLNRAEAELLWKVTEQVHLHLLIPEEAIVSAPGQVDHRLRNRGARQSDWQPTEQRRNTSRPRYNNNQESFEGRQYGQKRQKRDSYDGQPRTYNRGSPLRREMQPSFFRGGREAPRGGINRFGGQATNTGQNWGQN